MSRINIEVPNEEHQRLKIIAAAFSTSIKDLVLSAIREKIESQLDKVPNETTLQAFKETDLGIGLVRHQNLSALFKDLGITDDKSN
jgi:hypothetical protein